MPPEFGSRIIGSLRALPTVFCCQELIQEKGKKYNLLQERPAGDNRFCVEAVEADVVENAGKSLSCDNVG